MNRNLMGVFHREKDILEVTRACRERGYEIVDVYAPYPVHGLDRAMGLKPSRITWLCFALGAFGASAMLAFQVWTSAVDWPVNIGGKPLNSVPAFIPVTFESAVLAAGLGLVVGQAALATGGRVMELVAVLLIALVLDRFGAVQREQGQITLLWVILYGIARMVVELFRGDQIRGTLFGPLSTSQSISLVLVLGAASWMYLRSRRVAG